MKKIINENERGLLFQNGKFIKMLMPGKYVFFGKSTEIVTEELSEEFFVPGFDLELFLKDSELLNQLTVVDVQDQNLALHYENGKFAGCLEKGKHAFWSVYVKHTFTIVNMQNAEVDESIPKYIFSAIPKIYYTKIEVMQYMKARLYMDKEFVKLLDEGTYYFWNNGTKIEADLVDTRLLQLNVAGQEVLTLDKVALRINLICSYKITDCIKVFTEIDDYTEQIHTILQLALREYVGKYRFDEILENKEEISKHVFDVLKEKEDMLFIHVVQAGVKDIIIPGEIRAIMNTVLIAEKTAQANVITRREEVASTRSLLNTAKLMDENKTLYKLKELEYLEKICENVGSISVGGGSDLLSQLTKILKGA